LEFFSEPKNHWVFEKIGIEEPLVPGVFHRFLIILVINFGTWLDTQRGFGVISTTHLTPVKHLIPLEWGVPEMGVSIVGRCFI
jgi:hypothetical protein